MKKLALVFIVLIGGAGGAYYYFNLRTPVEKPTVTYTTISQGDITETVSATGTLEALRTVAVGSQVSGVVQDIFADFNYIVKQGQVLAKIDPALLQVQVDLGRYFNKLVFLSKSVEKCSEVSMHPVQMSAG